MGGDTTLELQGGWCPSLLEGHHEGHRLAATVQGINHHTGDNQTP